MRGGEEIFNALTLEGAQKLCQEFNKAPEEELMRRLQAKIKKYEQPETTSRDHGN